MKFYNTLTIPSGKECSINEITNEEYLTLLKFIQAGNKKQVFKILDSHIKETVPFFDELDIINKAYLYIAFVFLNIKASVHVNTTNMGTQEISLIVFLNNIENGYEKNKTIECKINDSISIVCGIPKSYTIEEDNFIIDYSSSIYSVKKGDIKLDLSLEQSREFCKTLPTKEEIYMVELIEEHIKNEVNVTEGVPFFSLKYNTISADTFNIVYQILNESLEDFYNKEYIMCHYAKFSRADFLAMTPLESHLLLNQFIKDKQEQAEKQKELSLNKK